VEFTIAFFQACVACTILCRRACRRVLRPHADDADLNNRTALANVVLRAMVLTSNV
jgi:hypothetical protein